MPAERRGRVMGAEVFVVAVGDGHLTGGVVDEAFARLADLERRWSRFLPTSELSRMNALAGAHVVVSPETLLLVQCAQEGWERSGGLFDPTVLPAVRAAGYDRDFASVPAHAAALDPIGTGPAPGCGGVDCDDRLCTVTVPPGVELDPGGIGKGLAADIVSNEMMERGARGALVNVGGDLRVRGEPPAGEVWDIAVGDPARSDRHVVRFGLPDGAVATSSRIRRSWSTRAGEMHHVIDPRTGHPSRSRYATVSAVAHEAWWAEVVTKAVLVSGGAIEEFAPFGARIVAIDDDGCAHCDPELTRVAA